MGSVNYGFFMSEKKVLSHFFVKLKVSINLFLVILAYTNAFIVYSLTLSIVCFGNFY